MKDKTTSLIMTSFGFGLLILNALGYILDWDSKNPAFTVLGLIFIVIGLKRSKSA